MWTNFSFFFAGRFSQKILASCLLSLTLQWNSPGLQKQQVKPHLPFYYSFLSISISLESVFSINSTVASSTLTDEMKQLNKNIHSLNIPWISKCNFENGFKFYRYEHYSCCWISTVRWWYLIPVYTKGEFSSISTKLLEQPGR